MTMLVKSLVALATEKMLLKTSGKTFLKGIDFMYAAGLAPERLSVMMTASGKYVLQFHSKCDIRPFAANYPTFSRVLRGIVHVRAWRVKSIEFVNVAFEMKDVDNLERAIEKLGVELVLLRNCTYPGVAPGLEAIRFLTALNRKKMCVVCEYGDERLKHRISARAEGEQRTRNPNPTVRNGQNRRQASPVPQPAAGAAAAPAAGGAGPAGAAAPPPGVLPPAPRIMPLVPVQHQHQQVPNVIALEHMIRGVLREQRIDDEDPPAINPGHQRRRRRNVAAREIVAIVNAAILPQQPLPAALPPGNEQQQAIAGVENAQQEQVVAAHQENDGAEVHVAEAPQQAEARQAQVNPDDEGAEVHEVPELPDAVGGQQGDAAPEAPEEARQEQDVDDELGMENRPIFRPVGYDPIELDDDVIDAEGYEEAMEAEPDNI